MTLELILRLLKNSGLNVLGTDSVYIYIEDPSCILRGFETFLEYAWIVIVAITGFLLFGWAVSLIRGAKTNIQTNIRNLLIMFMVLGLVRPIVNAVWGGDLFARGCKNIAIPIAEVQRILSARNSKLAGATNSLYEDFQIYDSGTIYTDSIDLSPVDVDAQSGAETNTLDANIVETSIDVSGQSDAGTIAVGVSDASTSNDVIYTNADGTKTRRTGGTLAWRNNNPGNIEYGNFAQQHGAIGRVGRFAVFPDEATGMAAIKSLLRGKSYRNLTISGAIAKYAPASENDTKAYVAHVVRHTGLDANRIMNTLSNSELTSMMDAMRSMEGQKVGKIIKM